MLLHAEDLPYYNFRDIDRTPRKFAKKCYLPHQTLRFSIEELAYTLLLLIPAAMEKIKVYS